MRKPMEAAALLDGLSTSPAVQDLIQGTGHLGALYPMEEALLLASAFRKDGKTRIIVKKNRYEARQLYERLAPLVPDTLLFSSEESLRVQSIASSPEDREQQLDVLIRLLQEDKPRLVITNTAGFLRFLPDADGFRDAMIPLSAGQQMDMAQLKQKLAQAGYARVNYVDRPMTYASRGGIVDIFPLDQDHPVRVEFFDAEIDSIRLFDENTQRTIRTVHDILITPASDLLLSESQKADIEQKVRDALEKELGRTASQEAKDTLTDAIEADLLELKSGLLSPAMYKYLQYIPSGQLLDYVKGEVVLSSEEAVERFEKQLAQDNITFIQELVQEHKSLPEYILSHDLAAIEQKQPFHVIHEFQDLHHPVTTGISPLDTASRPLDMILADTKSTDLFALGEEDMNRIKAHEQGRKFQQLEPVFYEGFAWDGRSVYTSRELFQKPVRQYKYQKNFKEGQILNHVLDLEKGDYVVHSAYGIGQYMGIVTRTQGGRTSDYLHIVYRGSDELYVPLSQFQLVRKYISKEGAGVKLSQLGSSQWQKTKERVSQKVEEIAGRLVELYADRSKEIGYAYPQDDALQEEFDNAFPYEPTPDQLQAASEIKAQMEKPVPMDHLLCGDVGFGKTEVAMRAAFKAIQAGKQVAVLCPTTVLALQHFKSFQKRFAYTGANVEMVSRFVPDAKVKEIKEGLKKGTVDIVIGTHKLLSKEIAYKDLGLLVIDEEQRFGVEHKERIKELHHGIDVLSLSATPIPRTLQMSLIGVRTISQLNTPPAHRHPIQTYVMEKRGTVVQEVIQRELARNGQVFYLYNQVANIYAVAQDLQKKFPGVSIGVAHGRMNREEIEQTMVDFAEGKYQILVCTTIIETGLDIENANTMIIENADHFGLSQLYQIRGRVGRRDKIAYCYLLVEPKKELTEQSRKRLRSIREFTQLGSGYKVAMRDLTIRGAGDMLGPQQAGFIDQVGLDMYLEMLAEAIARKQGKPAEEAPQEKVSAIQTDGYIPAVYAGSDGDKLSLYQDIKKARTPSELAALEERVKDLFGRMPKEVSQLFRQRQLDFFVNLDGVESMKDLKDQVLITMSPEWTRQADGVKLFGEVGKLSRTIQLKLVRGRIEISVSKKSRKYLDQVLAVADLLENRQEEWKKA